MNKAYVGQCFNEEVSGLGDLIDKLLNSWIAAQEKYFEVKEKPRYQDMAYYYNERANVSLLAAAAWRLSETENFTAIEEYSVKRNNTDGRCDLWLNLAGYGINVEAKIFWPTSEENAIYFIDHHLKAAKNQLAGLNEKDRSILRLSACFVVPWLNPGSQSHDRICKSIWNQIENEYSHDDSAFAVFNPTQEQLEQIQWQSDDGFYPGVALILKKAYFNPSDLNK